MSPQKPHGSESSFGGISHDPRDEVVSSSGIAHENGSDEEDDESLAKTDLATSIPDASIPVSIHPLHTGRSGWEHKLVPARKVRELLSRHLVDAHVSGAVTPGQIDLKTVLASKPRLLVIRSFFSPDRQIVALREKRPEMVWQSYPDTAYILAPARKLNARGWEDDSGGKITATPFMELIWQSLPGPRYYLGSYVVSLSSEEYLMLSASIRCLRHLPFKR